MKKGELIKLILLAVATAASPEAVFAGFIGTAILTAPLDRWYRRQDKNGKYRVRKKFAELQREKLIEVSETPDGKTKVALTESGKKKVLQYQFEDLKITPLKKWDKKWRMVIFDIPEPYKRARETLRAKLRELGFHQLQKSVFVHSQECRNEIEFVVEFLGVSPYVRMAEVSRFDGDDELRSRFFR
ncbi:MAG: hypothetical protein HY378_00010 [Candidatus Brennerbacteria bacterium]|nr:hypothetical protein [Candidatus Brennerbacteria bacterium]